MLYTINTITPVAKNLREAGKSLVLATGFFDLLHQEHRNFLKRAKESGDALIVAVESDERARLIKGPDRPRIPQPLRCQTLLDLGLADYVVALGSDFDHFEAYDSLMSAIAPAVYAISSHTEHQKSKQFLVEKYGGQLVVVHEWNPEISTTQIINNQNRL